MCSLHVGLYVYLLYFCLMFFILCRILWSLFHRISVVRLSRAYIAGVNSRFIAWP